MAVAAATTLPAALQAGVPSASLGGSNSRMASKRYRKYELIGQGAQKKVYRAFDEERGIEVAWNEVAVAELARFREKDQQRVFAEIRVLKQLKHKNIMTLHDYWFDERRLLLVFITEIFPDGTLRQYRRRHKHADLPAIKRWAWQILQGLVYLHGHNPPIIHRDLKCDNIFVCGSSGVVKIGDLGLVTLCRDFSAPQSVLGTPEFMAPELYEEKYDEKVDVYAFGMCLLELATMEYPYSECKNAAQIYKKVTQGIPPASVDKLASSELRDFVMLCICHDPSRRPEARQLLKHPFFEAIRAAPPHTGTCGTSPKLNIIATSFSLSPTAGVARPGALTGSVSAPSGPVEAAAAAAGVGEGLSPTALSRAASSNGTNYNGGGSSGGGAVDGNTAAAVPATELGPGSVAAATGAVSPLLNARSASVEMSRSFPQLHLQLPLGPIAASLSPRVLSPIAAAALDGTYGMDHHGSGSGRIAPAVSMPIPTPAPSDIAGGIAANATAMAATAHSPCVLGINGRLSVSPFSVGGPGSIASSLSPATGSVVMSGSFATAVGSGAAAAFPGPAALGTLGAALGACGDGGSSSSPALLIIPTCIAGDSVCGPVSPTSALAGELLLPRSLGCRGAPVPPGAGLTGPGCAASAAAALPTYLDAAGQCGVPVAVGNGCVPRAADGRSQQSYGPPYAGVSPSAAAIAAAAVSAAAAAVGASNGQPLPAPLGLPAIHEDHELHEDMMFDQEDWGRRSTCCGGGNGYDGSDDDDKEEGREGCGCEEDCPASSAVVGGCRSQPVSLKVRSSGQAAVTNMALSFAMSFTNQRGVRKKVGFQYDLLHDTASAIAVEMVENLSLNTAEAEAIAAMIQHEVSRFNMMQQQEQQQQQQS